MATKEETHQYLSESKRENFKRKNRFSEYFMGFNVKTIISRFFLL